jgi:uncharacterized damage-inducible protein DinB
MAPDPSATGVKPLLVMLADYNAWANERLYGAAAALPEADYRADGGAFFGSLHGTLNHLLVADRIWMHVFTGEGEKPRELDAILYDDLASLGAARRAEDARIRAYIASLSGADLAGVARYRTVRSPADIEQELAPLLIHFFNHQTHHRGQAHSLLTRAKGEAPSLDLFIFQRQTGASIVKGSGGDFTAPERIKAAASPPAPS